MYEMPGYLFSCPRTVTARPDTRLLFSADKPRLIFPHSCWLEWPLLREKGYLEGDPLALKKWQAFRALFSSWAYLFFDEAMVAGSTVTI